VQAKVAKSRIRLRVILRGPDLSCESLQGFGCPTAVRGDVAGVGAGDEGDPLAAGQDGGGRLPAGQDQVAAPAVGERARVARVVQNPQHGVGADAGLQHRRARRTAVQCGLDLPLLDRPQSIGKD